MPRGFAAVAPLSDWKLPDLSDLRRHGLSARSAEPRLDDAEYRRVRQLLLTFIRLTEKAVFEYEHARAAIERLASRRGASALDRALSHLETCINSLSRAHKCLEQLTKRGSSELERTVRRSLTNRGKRMKALRDTIEHIDEKIANGHIDRGEWIGPMLSDDGSAVQVGKEAIPVADLAAMIRALWEVANDLSTRGVECRPE